jgi:hypothetical protein
MKTREEAIKMLADGALLAINHGTDGSIGISLALHALNQFGWRLTDEPPNVLRPVPHCAACHDHTVCCTMGKCMQLAKPGFWTHRR